MEVTGGSNYLGENKAHAVHEQGKEMRSSNILTGNCKWFMVQKVSGKKEGGSQNLKEVIYHFRGLEFLIILVI